jgi:hypothetical protein
MNNKERTQIINKIQKKYPYTRRQRTDHGCGRFSVQFFDKKTGELVADVNLKQFENGATFAL